MHCSCRLSSLTDYLTSLGTVPATCVFAYTRSGLSPLTTPFNNMRTLKFKAQPTDAFFATVNHNLMFGGSFRLLPSTLSLSELYCALRFDHRELGNRRKLEGAAEHLIDSSEKHICRLSFEICRRHVIERRSNCQVYSGLITGRSLCTIP